MAVALLLAAGRGERLGFDRPKALVPLAGKPLLQWSLDALAAHAAIERIVLALPPDLAQSPDLAQPAGLLQPPDLAQPAGLLEPPTSVRLPSGAVCVPGGAVRSESVRLALGAAGEGDPVLVHDAARPLLDAELIDRTLAAVTAGGVEGAIAAAPVSDTIKRASSGPVSSEAPPASPPIVTETLDRAGLWAVQTPQVFRREPLERALDVPIEVLAAATDDAWLIERAGGRVALVAADPGNLKVTTRVDLHLAEMLLAERREPGRG
jgi:2-C-methyl-D-erythritol 4-phosphate cytidylyltransferase